MQISLYIIKLVTRLNPGFPVVFGIWGTHRSKTSPLYLLEYTTVSYCTAPDRVECNGGSITRSRLQGQNRVNTPARIFPLLSLPSGLNSKNSFYWITFTASFVLRSTPMPETGGDRRNRGQALGVFISMSHLLIPTVKFKCFFGGLMRCPLGHQSTSLVIPARS